MLVAVFMYRELGVYTKIGVEKDTFTLSQKKLK